MLRRSPIAPAEVYLFPIDLWATSYVVPPGHRLRVEISSSNFPRFTRNLNTGHPFGMSDEIMVADQTVYHTGTAPVARPAPRRSALVDDAAGRRGGASSWRSSPRWDA